MKKFTQPFYCLLVVCCCGLSPAFAQQLAYRVPAQVDQANQKALRLVLEELAREYSVDFTYQSALIENKRVNQTLEQDQGGLDKTLNKILKPLDLEHRRVDKGYYLIYPATKSVKRHPIEKVRWLSEDQSTTMAGIPDRPLPSVARRGDLLTQALEKTITGKVTDLSSGEELPGVNIVVKGTTVGTVTDIEGNYRLTAPDDAQTLVFSSVGYASEEVAINDRTVIDLAITPDIQSLQEVVVIGYQAVKKSDIVGSVSVVDTEEMAKAPASNVGQMLQGRAAGVTVTSTGAPGQASSVKIRGLNSFSGQDSPLYVVDGMLVNSLGADFNPSDVEFDTSTQGCGGNRPVRLKGHEWGYRGHHQKRKTRPGASELRCLLRSSDHRQKAAFGQCRSVY